MEYEWFLGPRRGRVAEHPCWELVQRVDEHNCMICRICSKVVKCLNTRNAMQHFSSCHPQVSQQFFPEIVGCRKLIAGFMRKH